MGGWVGEENALVRQEGGMELSMYPQELARIPAETVRGARAASPKGTLAMRLRDELGAIYRDEQFVAVFATRGRPAEGRLSSSRDAGLAIGGRPDGSPSCRCGAGPH